MVEKATQHVSSQAQDRNLKNVSFSKLASCWHTLILHSATQAQDSIQIFVHEDSFFADILSYLRDPYKIWGVLCPLSQGRPKWYVNSTLSFFLIATNAERLFVAYVL